MPNRSRNKDFPAFSLVGDRISYWRQRRNLSRPELAKAAGIPYSTLAEIENNRQRGSTKITQIAAALRVNAHYLATDKGDPEDLTASPTPDAESDWPFPFDRAELDELDPIELELAGLRLQKLITEIKSRRVKHKPKKAS